MTKFIRMQHRITTDQKRRLLKLQSRTGVDVSNHTRIAISRYLEEEEMRLDAIKKHISSRGEFRPE